jgi:hypothetical protein
VTVAIVPEVVEAPEPYPDLMTRNQFWLALRDKMHANFDGARLWTTWCEVELARTPRFTERELTQDATDAPHEVYEAMCAWMRSVAGSKLHRALITFDLGK